MKKIQIILVIFSMLICGVCFSHHAMEYTEMDSYSTMPKGQMLFHLHYDYFVEDENDPTLDKWELTPGISYGIFDRLLIDFHVHFAKFGSSHVVDGMQADFPEPLGPSPFIEAGALTLHYRVTEHKQLPIDIAAGFTYEFPFPRSKKLFDGENVFEINLITSYDFWLHSNICLNLKFGKDGDEEITEWAIGTKHPVTSEAHGPAAGVEVLGDYDGAVRIIPGIYLPIVENTILKVGLGFGNDKSEENLRASISLLKRF